MDILGGMLGGGVPNLRDVNTTEAVCETLTALGSMKQVRVSRIKTYGMILGVLLA